MSEYLTAGQFATARRGGLTSYEADFIRAKTEAGVPLSAVSRMLGRNIESLRDHAAEIEPRGVVFVTPTPVGPRDPLDGVPKAAREVILAAADLVSLPVGVLVGRHQGRLETLARQHAMYQLRRVKDARGRPAYSYATIARFLRRDDHTTVMHGIRAHATRCGLDVPQ